MKVQLACKDEIPDLTKLIARSARNLCSKDYTGDQIEAALLGAWAVDTQLIDDQTYFVCVDNGSIIGCGGWSMRATLFGGDAFDKRNAKFLDSKTDKAKIRAFFVDPDHIGRDVGLSILRRCETEAQKAGFTAFELLATLTGARFYRRHDYKSEPQTSVRLDKDTTIMFVPMSKMVTLP